METPICPSPHSRLGVGLLAITNKRALLLSARLCISVVQSVDLLTDLIILNMMGWFLRVYCHRCCGKPANAWSDDIFFLGQTSRTICELIQAYHPTYVYNPVSIPLGENTWTLETDLRVLGLLPTDYVLVILLWLFCQIWIKLFVLRCLGLKTHTVPAI